MKRFLPIWIGLAALALLVGCGGALVLTTPQPVQIEAGEPLPASAAYGRWSFIVPEAEVALRETVHPGEYPVALRVWGIPLSTTLTVRDSISPALEPHPQTCFLYDELPIEAFATATDATAVSLRWLTAPDFALPGTQTVRLAATDRGGNVTEADIPLTVHAISHHLEVEAGTAVEALREQIASAMVGEVEFGPDLAAFDGAQLGVQYVTVSADGEKTKLSLTVIDTTPPTGSPRRVELPHGGEPEPADFVEGIVDATAVTVTYAAEPDLSPGARTVKLTLTDEGGNERALVSILRVYRAPREATVECGPVADLLAELSGDESTLTLDPATAIPEPIAPGRFTLRWSNPRGVAFAQTVTLVDTTLPAVETQNRTAYVGDSVEIDDFIVSVTDATATTLAYRDGPPDLSAPGQKPVYITVTDAGGNAVTATAILTVVADTTPPVLSGVVDRLVYMGESVSYRTGVSAWDTRDGNVAVKIDSSAVNLRAEGQYPVTFSATDRAGNTVTRTVTYTVRAVADDSLKAEADAILGKILRDGMSERERLRAIYDWVCANLRYTAYPDKSDRIGAAYYGFRNGRGDCFVYYAVTRFLLDRAGIENLEIHRDNPSQPHFWNLVKFEGNWYHLDTCPHYAAHPLTCFLLTDAEVKAYSENHVKDYYSFDASLYPATP